MTAHLYLGGVAGALAVSLLDGKNVAACATDYGEGALKVDSFCTPEWPHCGLN